MSWQPPLPLWTTWCREKTSTVQDSAMPQQLSLLFQHAIDTNQNWHPKRISIRFSLTIQQGSWQTINDTMFRAVRLKLPMESLLFLWSRVPPPLVFKLLTWFYNTVRCLPTSKCTIYGNWWEQLMLHFQHRELQTFHFFHFFLMLSPFHVANRFRSMAPTTKLRSSVTSSSVLGGFTSVTSTPLWQLPLNKQTCSVQILCFPDRGRQVWFVCYIFIDQKICHQSVPIQDQVSI